MTELNQNYIFIHSFYWFQILTRHISLALLFLRRMWQPRIRWFEATSWQNHHCVITSHSSKMTWWQMFWWEDVQRLFATRALPLQTPSCAGSCNCWQLVRILLCVQPLIFLWSPYLENAFTFNIFSSYFNTNHLIFDLWDMLQQFRVLADV